MDVIHDLDGGSGLDRGIALADSAPLPILTAGGFGASLDAYACETDPEDNPPKLRLWLLSLLGSKQSVNALWARLVKGETATLSTAAGHAYFCVLASDGPHGWRFFRASLPMASAYQGVLVPDIALFAADRTDFLLLRRAADDVAMLHYRFLSRRVPLPLHPTWAGWLWERALRTGEARRLESHGLEAYRCAPEDDALAVDLSEAIGRNELGLTDQDCDDAPTVRGSSSLVEGRHGAP